MVPAMLSSNSMCRESLDSVDEVALKVVGFSGAANERKTLMEFLERNNKFSAGEVRTERNVDRRHRSQPAWVA